LKAISLPLIDWKKSLDRKLAPIEVIM